MSIDKVIRHKIGFLIGYFMVAYVCLFFIILSLGLGLYANRTEMLERTAMPMVRNYDMVSLFLDHSPSQGAISTDGSELKSYSIIIARWDGDEIVMPGSSVFHSITTTKHRNLVRAMALAKHITVREVD